jgi:hypothetical protein
MTEPKVGQSDGRGSAVDMKRTTGGLLQGPQRGLTRQDLEKAVHFLRDRVTQEQAKALRLDRFAELPEVSSRDRNQRKRAAPDDVQDLQRLPKFQGPTR